MKAIITLIRNMGMDGGVQITIVRKKKKKVVDDFSN